MVKACPKCGNELTYIEQYGRWYCYACQQYQEPVEKEINQQTQYLTNPESEGIKQYSPSQYQTATVNLDKAWKDLLLEDEKILFHLNQDRINFSLLLKGVAFITVGIVLLMLKQFSSVIRVGISFPFIIIGGVLIILCMEQDDYILSNYRFIRATQNKLKMFRVTSYNYHHVDSVTTNKWSFLLRILKFRRIYVEMDSGEAIPIKGRDADLSGFARSLMQRIKDAKTTSTNGETDGGE